MELLEMDLLLEARTSCGPGQAGARVKSSGTFGLSSCGVWVLLFEAGDHLRERLQKES
jgi:hypothetical protein